jgi:hypothetical protein
MTDIPKGYWQDARGNLIPVSKIKDIDKSRDAVVRSIVDQAQKASAELAAFKERVMTEVAAFADLSASQYGVTVGGSKGNITLTSFDGRWKVIRAMQDSIAFDERLQVAKAIIDECIHGWVKGSRHEIQALVNNAFQVDKAGQVSVSRVLGLRQLKIEDARWQQAMTAIQDSMRVTVSKAYIRIYERDDAGNYRPITLDVAA